MAKVEVNEKNNLLLLFERPTEPSFIPKGDSNVVFDVPQAYLSERYKSGPSIVSKFGEDAIHVGVGNIVLPDMTFATKLPRRAEFSLFLPWHREISARLINIFMGMRNLSDLTSVALYARDNLNPQLFIYAYSVALLHRPDTRNLPLPPLTEVFPDKFLGGGVFGQIKEEINVAEEKERVPIIIPRDYTASDLEEEHRLAYFREDVGVNLHHWHWHLVYPSDGADEIVNKDRRGELFYYMHHQLLARYNLERFSNQLPRTKRFVNIREPMVEGYFPKLDSLVSSQNWPSRHSNAVLRDINREKNKITFDLADIERWRERIYQAIHSGFAISTDGKNIPLTETDGIDILGNMMESSSLSVNRKLYGQMHGMGHVAIALCHDPDNRHLESFGVMGNVATAMRDPMFYRWHTMVDDMFQDYKTTLPPYPLSKLKFTGVKVTNIEVNIINPSSQWPAKKNVLHTFWQQNNLELSRGMDFNPRGPVYATITHLQHDAFSYKITVVHKGQARQGTCRIFMGPKSDETGLAMLFRDQKELFIEMDKFVVNLKPGTNTLERLSSESSVTIPFERTFRDLTSARPDEKETQASLKFNFCGCGWPAHMLLPKSTTDGMDYHLFVMVSDHEVDKIEQNVDGICSDAASFCGLRDKKYPDTRSMGYPFDRQPRDNDHSLDDFLTSNMLVQDIAIRHLQDRTEKPK